jgi:hypothetical protein
VGWAKAGLILVGVVAGIYALAEAKTGGLIFHDWLLLPPRSYLALLGAVVCLVAGAFLIGRGQRHD